VLSERFIARYPSLKVGDTIRLKMDGKESDWVLVGFFQLAGKSGGLVAYTNYEYLSGLMNQRDRSNTYRVVAENPGLSTDEQEQLGELIEGYLTRAGLGVSEITAGTELQTSTSRGLDLLTTFLLIMAGLTALVGSIGLAGTMSLNVMERTREIGVLRAVGATNMRLFGMVVIEGGLIGLISWVIGSLVSCPISKVMSDTINQAVFDTPSTFTWSINGFVIWLGIVLALSVSASLLPARNATRLTIREVLAYE
ncbi:MAG TPA: FtsX-like permease family protein, partial [Anaerolineaceae bacterium]|nr:FtsX-like permease family protein [Anaerolineaceae bacterium]